MAGKKGRPRTPALDGWREIRVKLPAATHVALHQLSKETSEKMGFHLGVGIVVANMLTIKYAPQVHDEIRTALGLDQAGPATEETP